MMPPVLTPEQMRAIKAKQATAPSVLTPQQMLEMKRQASAPSLLESSALAGENPEATNAMYRDLRSRPLPAAGSLAIPPADPLLRATLDGLVARLSPADRDYFIRGIVGEQAPELPYGVNPADLPGADTYGDVSNAQPAMFAPIGARSEDPRRTMLGAAQTPAELAAAAVPRGIDPTRAGQVQGAAGAIRQAAEQQTPGQLEGNYLARVEEALRAIGWQPQDARGNPMRAATMLGMEQQTERQIAEAGVPMMSPVENFAASAMGTLAQVPQGVGNLIAPNSGVMRDFNEAAATVYANDPNSLTGVAGQVVGTGLTIAGLAPAGSLGAAGVYGASSAGGVRQEVADRRRAGQDIGAVDEWTAAIGSGIVEVLAEKVGIDAAFGAVRRISAGQAGRLGRMLAEGNSAGFRAAAMNTLEAAGVNAAEEWVTQIGQNALQRATYAPERGTFEGAGQAALVGGLTGGAVAGVGGAAGRLDAIRERNAAARAVSPFFRTSPVPSEGQVGGQVEPVQPQAAGQSAAVPQPQEAPSGIQEEGQKGRQEVLTLPAGEAAQPAPLAPPASAAVDALVGEPPAPNEVGSTAAPRGTEPQADSSTGLVEMGSGLGKGAVSGMYDMLWEKAQKGDTTEGGAPSVVLQVAKQARDYGGVQTREEFEALAQNVQKVRDRGLNGREYQRALKDVVAMHTPTERLSQIAEQLGAMPNLTPNQQENLAAVTAELNVRGAGRPTPTPTPPAPPAQPAAEATHAPAPAGKQPWEMTKDQWNALYVGRMKDDGTAPLSHSFEHLKAVREAVARGENVPSRVLADYPDLAPWMLPKAVYEHAVLLGKSSRLDAKTHSDLVAQAVRDGKPVPPAVLAEYPDLQQQAAPAPTQPPAATGDVWAPRPALKSQPEERIDLAPQAYLDAVAAYQGGKAAQDAVMSSENVDKLRAKMEAGVKIDPPTLRVDADTGRIVEQEGRHRAKAAAAMGIPSIPAFVSYVRNGRFVPPSEVSPAIRNSVGIPPSTPAPAPASTPAPAEAQRPASGADVGGAGATQPPAPQQQPAPARPAPKGKKPSWIDQARDYYRPGRIVGVWGGWDKVLGFESDPTYGFRVTVESVNEDGSPTGDGRRSHATSPTPDNIRRTVEREKKYGVTPPPPAVQPQAPAQQATPPAPAPETPAPPKPPVIKVRPNADGSVDIELPQPQPKPEQPEQPAAVPPIPRPTPQEAPSAAADPAPPQPEPVPAAAPRVAPRARGKSGERVADEFSGRTDEDLVAEYERLYETGEKRHRDRLAALNRELARRKYVRETETRRANMVPVESGVEGVSLWAEKGKEAAAESIAKQMRATKPDRVPDYYAKKRAKATPKPSVPRVVAKDAAGQLAVLRKFEGEPDARGYNLAGVMVDRDGNRVAATDSRSLVVIERTDGATWGDDGRHLLAGTGAASKLEAWEPDGRYPGVDDTLKSTGVDTEQVGVVSVADTARRIRQAAVVMSKGQNGVVMVRNPGDGSLGFAARSPDTGISVVNVSPDAVDVGAVDPDRFADLLDAAYRATGGESVRLSIGSGDVSRPFILRAEGNGVKFTGLVMPVDLGGGALPEGSGTGLAKGSMLGQEMRRAVEGDPIPPAPRADGGAETLSTGTVTDVAGSPVPPGPDADPGQWEAWAKSELKNPVDEAGKASDDEVDGNPRPASVDPPPGGVRPQDSSRPAVAGEGAGGGRAGPADVLQAAREAATVGLRRASVSQVSDDTFVAKFPGGLPDLTFKMVAPGSEALARTTLIDRADSLVSKFAGLVAELADGQPYTIPATKEEVLQEPPEIIEQLIGVNRVAGSYDASTNTAFIRNSDIGTAASAVAEESFHHFFEHLPQAYREALLREFETEERVYAYLAGYISVNAKGQSPSPLAVKAAKRVGVDLDIRRAGSSGFRPSVERPKAYRPPPSDRTVALHAVIGAAKIAKGSERLTTWTRAMEAAGVTFVNAKHRMQVWKLARRLHKMDPETRAAAFVEWTSTPGDKRSVKSRVRDATGQVDESKLVKESQALRAKLRAAQQASEEGWKAAVTESSGIRSEFARIVRETLPAGEREGILGRLKSMNTVGDFNAALIGLERAFGSYDLRSAMAEFKAVAASFDADKLKPEMRDKAKTILDAITTEGDDAARARAKAMLDYVQRDPDHMVPDDLLDAAQRLVNAKDIRAMAPADIRAAAQALRVIKHQSELWNKLRVAGQVRQAAEVVADVMTTFEGVPDLKPGIGTAVDSDGSPLADVNRSWMGRFWDERKNPDAVAFEMDKAQDDGPWGSLLGSLRRGHGEALSLAFAAHDRLGTVLKAEDIGDWGSKKLREFAEERVEGKDAKGRAMSLTRAQRVGLAGNLMDRETREKIVANGFKLDGRRNVPAFRVDEAWAREFLAGLDPRERAVLDAMKAEFNGTLKDQQNAVFVRMLGYERLTNPDYWPSKADRTEAQTGPVAGTGQMMRRYLESMGVYKDRESHRLPMVVGDAFQVFAKHLVSATNFVANAENLHTYWAVLGTPEVTQEVRKKYGEDRARSLRDIGTAAALNEPPGEMTAWAQKTETILANASKAALATPTAAAVQFTGVMALAVDLGVGNVAAAAAKITADPSLLASTWDSLRTNGILRARYEGDPTNLIMPRFERDEGAYGRQGWLATLKEVRTPADVARFINRHALDPMQWADYVNAVVAYHATDAALPVAERAYRASVAIARTQNANAVVDFAPTQLAAKTSLAARLQNTFGSQTVAMASLLTREITRWRWSKKGPNDFARLAGSAATILVGQSVAATAIRALIAGLRGDDDEEKTAAETAKVYGLKAAEDGLSVIFGPQLGGTISQLAQQVLSGRQVTVPDSVVVRGPLDIMKGVQDVMRAGEMSATGDAGAQQRWVRGIHRLIYGTSLATGQSWLNIGNQFGKAYSNRAFRPPPEDPRIVQRREADRARAEVRKSVRNSLPPKVRSLLDEKNKLDRIPERQLTSTERARRNRLAVIESNYERLVEAEANGKRAAADAERRALLTRQNQIPAAAR